MSVHRIAVRYAKSLVELAQEQNKLETIMKDIKSFKNALGTNRDLFLLLKSPIVNANKKKQIFKALFEGKYDEMTVAFLNILATKGREVYMPEIADEFILQYKHIKHISTVTLTTASQLDEATLEAIRKKLEESDATDQQVELVNVVDSDLIGGFVVEFEDKIYDASVVRKLEELKRTFKGNLYVSQISQ
jgi:F-type H+-transporting ATPase subunit delta